MPQETPRKMLQLQAPSALTAAVKIAADREMTTISEFVRRVLIDRLRSDGIDPGKMIPARQEKTAHEHVAVSGAPVAVSGTP
jgi:hypothetical protein